MQIGGSRLYGESWDDIHSALLKAVVFMLSIELFFLFRPLFIRFSPSVSANAFFVMPSLFNVNLYDPSSGSSKLTNCVSVDENVDDSKPLSTIRDLLVSDKMLDSDMDACLNLSKNERHTNQWKQSATCVLYQGWRSYGRQHQVQCLQKAGCGKVNTWEGRVSWLIFLAGFRPRRVL